MNLNLLKKVNSMELVAFTDYLVKNLVKQPDMVSVKKFDDEDEYIIIQILVSDEDMGTLIGRNGNTINAIRTLVQSSAYINNEKKVKINVDSF